MKVSKIKYTSVFLSCLFLFSMAGNGFAGEGSSKTKFVFMSLLLPGSGEWMMGHRNLAKVFIGSEVVLWAGYFGTRGYIGVLEDNFQNYAAVHAGVRTGGKDDQYWIDVGNADNIYAFNEKRLVERRLDDTYREIEDNFWQWDNPENRNRYNDMRFKHHDWKQRINIVIGGFILNRLVSAIDVVRLMRKEKKEGNQISRLYFDMRNTREQGDLYRLNFRLNW